MPAVDDPLARLAAAAGAVANYCDHAEHVEETDRAAIGLAGRELRALACEMARGRGLDIVHLYRMRLDAIEHRHPLYPVGGFDGASALPTTPTWRDMQSVQWEHDRNYHPDVLGLTRLEQLRHYAFHLAKLVAALTGADDGSNAEDFYTRRLPDVLLFGVKLATLLGEELPADSVA